MKKFFLVSLTLGFGRLSLTSVAQAFKAEDTILPGTYRHELSIQQKLNEAIELRWGLFRKKHMERNTEQKTIPYQRATHEASEKANNVQNNPNVTDRQGPLVSIPTYEERKPATDMNYFRPNPKAVFRKRIIDYYVDGGDAGKTALQSDVLLGSEYRVPRYYPIWATSDGESLSAIRAIQREMTAPDKVGAGQQSMSSNHKGSYYRNFMHPYMFVPFPDEDENMEQYDGGFYSTEAE
jgi:hypothetical protein